MLIGYAWVSTAGEILDLQIKALDQAGVDRLLVDVACGAKAKRPQLERALSELRPGDTLAVCTLDRLARGIRHLVETVEGLDRRGIAVRSLAENIDTTTSMGKLMFQAFGQAMAQLERDLIREKTRTRQTKARPRGRRGGRKPKLDKMTRAQAVMRYSDPDSSIDDICQEFQMSRRTLLRYVAEERRSKARSKSKAKKPAVRTPALPHRIRIPAERTAAEPLTFRRASHRSASSLRLSGQRRRAPRSS